MTKRKAIIVGATGLIGESLTELLLDSSDYQEVYILSRRETGKKHPKLIEKIIDFGQIHQYVDEIPEGDLFCCIGTTMKKAKSKEAFRKVDFSIPVDISKFWKIKIKKFILISSIGANKKSSNFYLKTKGETEEAIINSGIKTIHILRPSILLGKRKELRTGERIGILLIKLFNPLLKLGLKKYRGIEAKTVAQTMIQLALSPVEDVHIYESDEIREISKQKINHDLPKPDF